eukprot:c20791_g4_i2.p1 GENE.c20791_g4_i2~~c20791_g4_i2.p1  ORF type:complete len:316 (+),score=83.23 c20791_g4_i2:82-948(+)
MCVICTIAFFVGATISHQAVTIKQLDEDDDTSKTAASQPQYQHLPTLKSNKCFQEENIRNLILFDAPIDGCSGAELGLKSPTMAMEDKLSLFDAVKSAETYVEFGTTAATNTLALLPKRSVSIDHNLEACYEMQTHPAVQWAETTGKMRTYCVDTGVPTNSNRFGRAICDTLTPEECASRHVTMLNALDDAVKSFLKPKRALDVVFIDGRFRVPCALKALQYADANTVVFVHDWRPQFEEKLSNYFIIDSDISERTLELPLAKLTPRPKYYFDSNKVYQGFLTMEDEA